MDKYNGYVIKTETGIYTMMARDHGVEVVRDSEIIFSSRGAGTHYYSDTVEQRPAHDDGYDDDCELPGERRTIHEMVFMGNGEASMQRVQYLHRLLADAVSLLSAMQQPPMATDPPGSVDRHSAFIKEAQGRIKTIAEDLLAALDVKTDRKWLLAIRTAAAKFWADYRAKHNPEFDSELELARAMTDYDLAVNNK